MIMYMHGLPYLNVLAHFDESRQLVAVTVCLSLFKIYWLAALLCDCMYSTTAAVVLAMVD